MVAGGGQTTESGVRRLQDTIAFRDNIQWWCLTAPAIGWGLCLLSWLFIIIKPYFQRPRHHSEFNESNKHAELEKIIWGCRSRCLSAPNQSLRYLPLSPPNHSYLSLFLFTPVIVSLSSERLDLGGSSEKGEPTPDLLIPTATHEEYTPQCTRLGGRSVVPL